MTKEVFQLSGHILKEERRRMKSKALVMTLVLLLLATSLVPLAIAEKEGPKKTYSYASHCEYWPDDTKPAPRVWIKGSVEHRRNSYFIGIPPQTSPPTKPYGGITINVQDEEGTVYVIVGRVELLSIRIVVNRNIDPILRGSSGTIRIEVVTVNGVPADGSIEGVYSRSSRWGVKEVYTHGTGFFAGVKMTALGTTSSASMDGSRLYTVDMAGTIIFPN
jgi:hypothetical protein